MTFGALVNNLTILTNQILLPTLKCSPKYVADECPFAAKVQNLFKSK